MRLYPTNDVPRTVIDHPVWGRYEVRDHGGFDLPDELSDEMHSFCIRGKHVWETEDERTDRLRSEGLAHRRDPAALFETVSGMADLTRQLAAVQLGQSAPAPASPEDEIAALERRLAELRAGTAKDAEEAAPSEKPAGRSAAPKGAAKPDGGKAA
jgi:hypothetical protein